MEDPLLPRAAGFSVWSRALAPSPWQPDRAAANKGFPDPSARFTEATSAEHVRTTDERGRGHGAADPDADPDSLRHVGCPEHRATGPDPSRIPRSRPALSSR